MHSHQSYYYQMWSRQIVNPCHSLSIFGNIVRDYKLGRTNKLDDNHRHILLFLTKYIPHAGFISDSEGPTGFKLLELFLITWRNIASNCTLGWKFLSYRQERKKGEAKTKDLSKELEMTLCIIYTDRLYNTAAASKTYSCSQLNELVVSPGFNSVILLIADRENRTSCLLLHYQSIQKSSTHWSCKNIMESNWTLLPHFYQKQRVRKSL